jgi:protein-S-isoprenylcysteine O-methyltransferase Ste14
MAPIMRMENADVPALIAAAVVILSWLGFGGILIVGRKGAAQSATKRDLTSHLGFALQCAAYGICMVFHREAFYAFMAKTLVGDAIFSLAIVALAVASDWLCLDAARRLGKQWALVARVIEGHELIQTGPFAVVRNPIYLAMFLNILATALTFSTLWAIAAGVVVFVIGTEIRIRSEERLLREAFGPQFDEYARRVPALFPRLF